MLLYSDFPPQGNSNKQKVMLIQTLALLAKNQIMLNQLSQNQTGILQTQG